MIPTRPTLAIAIPALLLAGLAGPSLLRHRDLGVAIAAGYAGFGPPPALSVPAIVFVSRNPVPGDPAAIPGLGTRSYARPSGGRLLVRGSGGAIRELARGRFFDVADPSVSYDGRRIAFAATVAADSAWRIWVIGADGRGLAPVTRNDRDVDLSGWGPAAARFVRYDDFDPVWLPDGRLCFASTRYPQIAGRGGMPASNLFVVRADGTGLERITSERDGAEEPSVDPRTGRIVLARWWGSRYLASDHAPQGVTTDAALAVDAPKTDLWHAVAITPEGNGTQLAGGNPRVRGGTAAYQPVVLDDGTLVGVTAADPSLLRSGPVWVQAFPGGFGDAVRVPEPLGRRAAREEDAPYACAPVALSGRRILVSCDPSRRGDFGIFVGRIGSPGLERVIDLPGTHELDAAVLAPRRRPPRLHANLSALPESRPPRSMDDLSPAHGRTFRFDCLNVFANAPVDAPIPDAPSPQRGVRIRFFCALARPEAEGGDTLVLVREASVDDFGAVHEPQLPADTPMFEQLVDAQGHVLRSAMGPAHGPGFNVSRFGSGPTCMGCHAGHTAITVPNSATEGHRTNFAPAAEVSASSVQTGTAGARAAVDRRARGPAAEVAWVAEGAEGERLRLAWREPIDLQAIVLYGVARDAAAGTDLRIRDCELTFFRGAEVIARRRAGEIVPAGTRVDCRDLRADAVTIVPTRLSGRVLGRPHAALAEVEAVAQMAVD